MARPVSPNLAAWIAEYEAGAALMTIAERYGVRHSQVWRALRKARVEMRRRGGKDRGGGHRSSDWHVIAIAAHERGETCAAIAAQYGVTPQAVSNAIRRSRA